jgi:biopolymer transport protein ExbD
VKPPHPINFEELIDMTAMVDIVFFLLIFFLVTSMHALDSTIPMPPPNPEAGSGGAGGSTTVSAEAEDIQIIVNIDRNDVIRIEGTEITGPRDLLFKLREIRNGPGRPEKLLVVGSGDASHGTTVMVLDAGHDVGMESVKLAVRDEVE